MLNPNPALRLIDLPLFVPIKKKLYPNYKWPFKELIYLLIFQIFHIFDSFFITTLSII